MGYHAGTYADIPRIAALRHGSYTMLAKDDNRFVVFGKGQKENAPCVEFFPENLVGHHLWQHDVHCYTHRSFVWTLLRPGLVCRDPQA
jgi:hypothetical protein